MSADDDCKALYECEKRGNCPGKAAAAAAAIASTDETAKQQLRQLAICVEKFDANPLKGVKAMTGNAYQQAAFLLGTLWDVTDTVKISFMDVPAGYPGEQPQWDGGSIVPKSTSDASVGVTMAPMSQNACQTDGDCTRAMGAGMSCVNNSCVEDLTPKWYTRNIVLSKTLETLTPEEEEFERKVRTMPPIDAIKYIVMNQLQPLVGLKFEFVESDGDIRISLDSQGGAWSLVGIQCRTVPSNEATLNLGWLDVATIIHEFCHALGMIHEHQNPFGKGIDWNKEQVYAWANATQGWDMYTTCANIVKKYNVNSVNGSEYDPKSIMLYSYPAELTNNNQGTYRNIKLSELDKLWLSKMYPPGGKPRSAEAATAGREAAGTDSAAAGGGGSGATKLNYYYVAAGVLAVFVSVAGIVWYLKSRKNQSKKTK